MAKNEAEIKFKAQTKEFNAAIKEMNAESTKLRQEFKLQSEQMKLSASETDKLRARMDTLTKQHDVASKATQATAEHLDKAKGLYGENSAEVAKLESQLRRNEITEQQLANRIDQTAESLIEAEKAERDRTSESAKAEQKLNELKETEEKLTNSTEKLNAEYELQKAQLGDNASETDKLKLKVDHLDKSHMLAAEQVKNYEEQLEQAKKQYGENSTEVDKYETQLLEAKTAEQQLANEIQATNKELKEQSSVAQKVAKSFKETGDKMKAVGKEMSMKVTAPILAMGAGFLKVGMDFEAGMSNVQAISGATGDDFDGLSEKARELGAKTSKSATEASEALGYMALAGWDTEQMLSGLEPILRLSEAGSIDLGKASDLVTDSMAALGVEVQDLPQYLDKVAQTARKSNTNIDMLMEAFVVAGGTMKDFNVPVEEASAFLGVLANRGFKAGEAGTALNAITQNLTSGLGASGKAMEELGISAFDSEGNFKGLEEVLTEVRDKTKGMTDEQRAQYVAMIAGKQHTKTFQALMSGLGDEYGALKDDIINSNGALDEMAIIMQDNAKGRITELKSALEEVGIAFSVHMIPFVTKATEKITELVTWFGELRPETQKTILLIGGMAAAIGPLLVVAGTLVSSIGAIAGSMTLLMGPVGAAILLVGGLSVATVGVYKEMQKASFESDIFGDEVSKGTQKAVTAFKDLSDNASIELDKLKWSGQTVTVEMADEISNNFNAMKDNVLATLDKQKNESLASLKEMFANSTTMAEEEKERLLEIAERRFEEEKVAVEEGQARIDEIVATAAKENREVTEAEYREINRIKNEWLDLGIALLSENEAEHLVIMERLKTESTKLAAEQAADVVKSSIEQRDKTVAAAEEEYNDRLKSAMLLRAEGTPEAIAAADEIIAEAERQRDDTISAAEEMHQRVVEEAKLQSGEHLNEINWFSGEVKTKWAQLREKVLIQAGLMYLGAVKSVTNFATDTALKFSEAKRDAIGYVTDMYTGVKGKFTDIVRAASEKFLSVKKKIIDPVVAARDAVFEAIEKIKGFFSNLKLSLPKITLPKMPTFTLKGQFSLKPPSVPKIGINWNAEGGIFNKPTIFNTANAGLQGVGEAGPEAILPLNKKVLGDIGAGIAATMREAATQSANPQVTRITVLSVLDGEEVARNQIDYIDGMLVERTEIEALLNGN